MKKQTLLLGAHVSIAGGIAKAIERGTSIGCTAIQIFTKSNRQWLAKTLPQEEIDAFKHALKNSFIKSVVAHASYLINCASARKEIQELSTKSLIDEINRCQRLGIPYLVLHPGSYAEGSEADGIERIAKSLDSALESAPGETKILLETMAGQGTVLGHNFEQLARIYKATEHNERLGICFDTCHAFVAGYPFSSDEDYQNLWKKFDSILGLSLLKVIHINDSKKGLGSRVDRHETVGKGAIGLKAFELLFNDERFFDVPKILETPKASLEDDYVNMKIIEGLITPENREKLEIMIPSREVK